MKYIIKGNEPKEFENWKKKYPNATYKDINKKNNKKNKKIKKSLYKALKKEQGYICCYCEQELKNNNYHIEHLEPQSKKGVDSLDFSNMLCSCQRNNKKGEPLHCGHHKGKKEIPISPLSPDCEKKFKYDGMGNISNNNDKEAKATIETLQLNIDKLKDLRCNTIKLFDEDDLSEDDIKKFVRGYLKKNNGKFNPFYTTIKYVFRDYI